MPLQISEIGVHMVVGDGEQAPAAAAAAAGAPATSTLSEADREDIVARCVAEVLRQLKQQQPER